MSLAVGLAISASAISTAEAVTVNNIALSTDTTANTAPVTAQFTGTNVDAGITASTDLWTTQFSDIVSGGVNPASGKGVYVTEGSGLGISNVFNVAGFKASDFTTDGTNVYVNIPVRSTLTAGSFNGAIAFRDASGVALTVNLSGTVIAPTNTNNTLTAATGKINDVREGTGIPLGSKYPGISVSGMATTNENGTNKRPSELNNLTIRPNADIKVYLTAYDFQFEGTNGTVVQGTEGQKVTTSQLRNGKITVKRSISKGSNVIDDIAFGSDSQSAYVHIKFVEYFVSVNEQDVDVTIYLAKSGSRRRGTDLNIAGTMANEVETVDAGDDYIDTSEGIVAKANDYVRAIEMYLGNGVYAKLNMFKSKKYYGVALNTYDTTDVDIMNQYPEISNVVHLRTVNLSGRSTVIYFDLDSNYYVYGSDGAYLGLSSEQVPYSDKYYFATSRITMVANENNINNEIGNETGTVTENQNNNNMGTTTTTPAPTTNNPNTGVNSFMGVAILAGVVSLAAAGVTISRKKK